MTLGFPDNRIIMEDRANSTVENAEFSVPLAKQADTSGIILVTSTTHQRRADGDFGDAGGNILATVSYPDENPSTTSSSSRVTQSVRLSTLASGKAPAVPSRVDRDEPPWWFEHVTTQGMLRIRATLVPDGDTPRVETDSEERGRIARGPRWYASPYDARA